MNNQQPPPMPNMSQQPNLPNYPQQGMPNQQPPPQQSQHPMNIPPQQNPQQFVQHQGQDIPSQYHSPQQQMPNPSNPQPHPQPSMLQGQLQARPNIPQNMQPNPNVILQQKQQLQQQHQQQQQSHPQQHPPQTMAQQPPSMICKFASELLQDFLTRTTETFQILRACSPYLTTNKAIQEDKRTRLRDVTKSLKLELVRLKSLYAKIRSVSVPDDKLPTALESIIQFEVEKPLPWDSPSDFEAYNSIDKMNTHESRWFSMKPGPQISEELQTDNPKIAALEQQYQELLEINATRNRQMKEVINQMRQLVWSTNDMLAMRKP